MIEPRSEESEATQEVASQNAVPLVAPQAPQQSAQQTDALTAAVAAATAAASAANAAASAAASAASAANTTISVVNGGAPPAAAPTNHTGSSYNGASNRGNGQGGATGYSQPLYPPPASGKPSATQYPGRPGDGLAALPPPEGYVPDGRTDGVPGATGRWKAHHIERGRFHNAVWDGSVDEDAVSVPIPLRVEWTPPPFFHLYASLEQNFARLPCNRKGCLFVGVTSSILGEGKTTCALHLALSAARATQKRVCLIDLSLGEDDLCRRIGASPAPGGAVSLIEENGVLGVMELSAPDNLFFIPAGKMPANPAQMARAKIMGDFFTTLRGEYDLIVADMPAVVTDNAVPLASLMDGVVLVMQAGATPRALVSDAIEKLGRDKVAGVVLNRMTPALVQQNLPTTRGGKKGRKERNG